MNIDTATMIAREYIGGWIAEGYELIGHQSHAWYPCLNVDIPDGYSGVYLRLGEQEAEDAIRDGVMAGWSYGVRDYRQNDEAQWVVPLDDAYKQDWGDAAAAAATAFDKAPTAANLAALEALLEAGLDAPWHDSNGTA